MTNKKGKKINNEIQENCRGQPPRNNEQKKSKYINPPQNADIKLYCEKASYTKIKKTMK
jgi:hypothetical protein